MLVTGQVTLFHPSLPKLLLLFFPLQVVDIMCVNVDKVLERDQKLSELDDRADALQAGASQFESSAAKLKRKYWWKNCKVSFLAPSCPLSEGNWASCLLQGFERILGT